MHADPDAPASSTPIICPSCGRAGVKPDTVLYGGALRHEFFDKLEDLEHKGADLLIVMGTSLTVSPANMIPFQV